MDTSEKAKARAADPGSARFQDRHPANDSTLPSSRNLAPHCTAWHRFVVWAVWCGFAPPARLAELIARKPAEASNDQTLRIEPPFGEGA
jgi:hypothetical protein